MKTTMCDVKNPLNEIQDELDFTGNANKLSYAAIETIQDQTNKIILSEHKISKQ